MTTEIKLNGFSIQADDYQEKELAKGGKERKVINLGFKVKSEEYHAVTTLLYQQTFDVEVPEKNIEFRGTITQYSTSFTNLYKENQVGDFQVELTETD